jgi:hypothetical protein
MPVSGFAHRLVVAFCGKLYPGYKTLEGEVFYSTERMERSFNKIIELNEPEHPKYRTYTSSMSNSTWKSRVSFLNKKTDLSRHRYFGGPSLAHNSWANFVENTNLSINSDAFRALKAPVFVLYIDHRSQHAEIVVNPQLKDFNFATQLDPYTAFQELSMYLGNDLVDQMDPNIERTDDLIRDQKGFDKWSFRKPGKKGMK